MLGGELRRAAEAAARLQATEAALRSVWEGSKTRVKIPKKFGEDLDRVDWLVEQLGRLGELPQGESVATALLPSRPLCSFFSTASSDRPPSPAAAAISPRTHGMRTPPPTTSM